MPTITVSNFAKGGAKVSFIFNDDKTAIIINNIELQEPNKVEKNSYSKENVV